MIKCCNIGIVINNKRQHGIMQLLNIKCENKSPSIKNVFPKGKFCNIRHIELQYYRFLINNKYQYDIILPQNKRSMEIKRSTFAVEKVFPAILELETSPKSTKRDLLDILLFVILLFFKVMYTGSGNEIYQPRMLSIGFCDVVCL